MPSTAETPRPLACARLSPTPPFGDAIFNNNCLHSGKGAQGAQPLAKIYIIPFIPCGSLGNVACSCSQCARMLTLCLATAALKLSRPPSLSRAEVDDLVARRTRLRSLRDFAAADAVKESLESAGVRLQDEVSCLC